jgi:hypothetical protein
MLLMSKHMLPGHHASRWLAACRVCGSGVLHLGRSTYMVVSGEDHRLPWLRQENCVVITCGQ